MPNYNLVISIYKGLYKGLPAGLFRGKLGVLTMAHAQRSLTEASEEFVSSLGILNH